MKLSKLKKIKVCGLEWTIEPEEGLVAERNAFAEIRPREQRIVYEKISLPERISNSIIHEVLEIINNEYDLEVTHKDLTIITNCFYEFLVSNDLMK